MAHQIFNQSTTVSIEHGDEALFDLLPDDGSDFSITRQLDAKFYGSMTISVGMIPQFRDEIERLLDQLSEQLIPQLKRGHQVTATDPSVAGPILDGLLARNPLYSKLKEIIELCNNSLKSNQPIECIGD